MKQGKLTKPTLLKCTDCDNQAKEYDHYLGYEWENWAKVEPVCPQCNKRREMKSAKHTKCKQKTKKKRF